MVSAERKDEQSRVQNLESEILPVALPRTISFLGSTALVVGTIIGSGIFLVPHNVALHVGTPASLFTVWVVGGLLSLAGALSLAELGAALPEAGGVYVYLREAYGKCLPSSMAGACWSSSTPALQLL
jgi:amino acid transporter